MIIQLEAPTSMKHTEVYHLILDAVPREKMYGGRTLLDSHRIIIRPPIRVNCLFLNELCRMFRLFFNRTIEIERHVHIRRGIIKVKIVPRVA